MQEIFKGVVGYEGLYAISNVGNVINLKTKKIIKPQKNNVGYYHVVLYNKGIKRTILVHKLIAITFLNHIPCGHKLIIDHINGVRSDNRLENLQLITQRENVCKANVTGKSIYKGVYWNTGVNKWVSQIHYLGKRLHLGCFTDEYDAHTAYQNKLKEVLG